MDEKFVQDNLENRETYLYYQRMIDLCYGGLTPNHERLDERAVPAFTTCVDKLTKGLAIISRYSSSLVGADEGGIDVVE